jgi:hypothetical protein
LIENREATPRRSFLGAWGAKITTERRRDAIAIVTLVVLKAAAMLYALHCGFQQISDDDYARVVIAQSFAHAPKLDPSGTSWLPLPFWLYGGLMMVLGRSLEVARGIAFVLGMLSPIVVYAGIRSMGVSWKGAWLGTLMGALTPWSVWLGLAPVPEAWAGACGAAALLFLASSRTTIAGLLSLVATLSRYETWPIALVVGIASLLRTRADRNALIGGGLALAGPALWLLNNTWAHHDPFNFIARVASFHRTNTPTIPLTHRLLEYPTALVVDATDTFVIGLVGVWYLVRNPSRVRWALPMIGIGAVLAFLIYGEFRDGAPTHHAVRALIPIIIVLAAVGGIALAERRHKMMVSAVVGWIAFVAWRSHDDVPGSSASEQRTAQMARGRALAHDTSLTLVPCAYEHFAFVAAYGEPERVRIEGATHEPVSDACPHVTLAK